MSQASGDEEGTYRKKKSLVGCHPRRVAGSTGLEPAASGVTGRRSNQLNYDPTRVWWAIQGSNL